MLVYQLSRGKIRIENEVQVLDATVKEVKSILWSSGQTGQKVEVLQPVFETIEGYPAADIFQSKNQQDGFIFLYPMDKKLIEQRAHGFSGPSYPMLVANTLDMSARRMGITLALDNSSIYRTGVVLVHEFFHNVEAAYEYGITHVYYDQFKALWPAWYKGGGELSYYEAYFRNIVDPKGYSQLYYKNNLDSVNEKDLERAVSYRDKYEAKRLKQSKEWMGKAWEWYNAGKKESAKASFLKAYELFPYAPRVNEMLGYLFYLDKDYKTALFHYLKEEETSSSPQNFYQMIAYLYEITNDLKQSGHYYAKLWEATPEFAKNLYLLGRNYYLRKDYKNALNYFEQYLAMKKENDELIAPVLEMSAYILCYQEKNLPKASLLVEKYIVLVNEPKAKGKLLFYAAYAYGESGNKAKAREYLALCRKLNYNENMDYYEKRYRE
jgi:tetratricopeptide (TPR) repeat protein